MKRRDVLLSIGTVVAATAAGSARAGTVPRGAPGSIAHGFHARMKAQPGQGDALVALLFEAPAFDHPDCKIFLVGRSKSDPDTVFVTEGWADEAAHARFTATDGAKSYIARFGPLVAESTISDEIPLGGKALLS